MASQSQRYFIGHESAEKKAIREQSRGWDTGCVDPGVEPEDYYWEVRGDDVLCHAVDPITPEYAQTLGQCLREQGARCVGVFDSNGKGLYGFFPAIKTKETEMSEASKQGKYFYLHASPGYGRWGECVYDNGDVMVLTHYLSLTNGEKADLFMIAPGELRANPSLRFFDDFNSWHEAWIVEDGAPIKVELAMSEVNRSLIVEVCSGKAAKHESIPGHIGSIHKTLAERPEMGEKLLNQLREVATIQGPEALMTTAGMACTNARLTIKQMKQLRRDIKREIVWRRNTIAEGADIRCVGGEHLPF